MKFKIEYMCANPQCGKVMKDYDMSFERNGRTYYFCSCRCSDIFVMGRPCRRCKEDPRTIGLNPVSGKLSKEVQP